MAPDPNRNALVEIERWLRFLREAVRGARIEDIPVRLTAVAVEMDTRERIWIDRGLLMAAMRANSVFSGVLTRYR